MTDWPDGLDLEGLDQILENRAADPPGAMKWARWHREWLADDSLNKLALTANQVGKTTCTAADIVMEIRGTNPYRARRWTGPINVIMVGESIEQMSMEGGPLEKLWEMIPKDEIDPRVTFERGFGIRGLKYPALPFIRGPGAGSVIRIRTYGQSDQSFAGATVHVVWCDEPAPESVYTELVPRLLHHRGRFIITFTPTLNMPDQGWLKKLVDDGVFRCHHVPFTEEATWLEGYARPLIPQAQIDAFARSIPEIQRGMRLMADWEPVVTGSFLKGFNRVTCVGPFVGPRAVPAGSKIVVGIDHGLKAGKQRAMLLYASQYDDLQRARVWWVDECGSDDYTSPKRDAQAILEMLKRNGLEYVDVDEWIGDVQTGDGRLVKAKTNGDLRRALLTELEISPTDERALWIHTPNKFTTSMYYGLHNMDDLFGSGRAFVSPACQRFIKACENFRGKRDDPLKDILDAGRYAFERAVSLKRSAPFRIEVKA